MLGALFVVVPLIAVAAKVDWPQFWSLITSPASLSALELSLRTAAASTALCLVLGVPMALVFARSDARRGAADSAADPAAAGAPARRRWHRAAVRLRPAGPDRGVPERRGDPDRVHDDGRGAGADLRVAAVPRHLAGGRGAYRRGRLRGRSPRLWARGPPLSGGGCRCRFLHRAWCPARYWHSPARWASSAPP